MSKITRCWSCGEPIYADASYCRHCEAPRKNRPLLTRKTVFRILWAALAWVVVDWFLIQHSIKLEEDAEKNRLLVAQAVKGALAGRRDGGSRGISEDAARLAERHPSLFPAEDVRQVVAHGGRRMRVHRDQKGDYAVARQSRPLWFWSAAILRGGTWWRLRGQVRGKPKRPEDLDFDDGSIEELGTTLPAAP